MAIVMDVVKDDLETLFVELNITGLTVGTKYDIFRLQVRFLGLDDTGARIYEHEVPDRLELWSSVAHRVGWTAPTATVSVRDYEAPQRPTKWFIVQSSLGGPHEWDYSGGDYPLSRGVLGDEVVHFAQDEVDANLGAEPDPGHVMLRSTNDLALYMQSCVVEMEGPKYLARGTELPVIGKQFPAFISDTREARRGTLTLMTRDLGAYNDLRAIVFPPSGEIRPVVIQSGGDSTLLLDDMRVIPLDVEVEQATLADPHLRYIHLDYVETDPTVPLIARIGDNDDLVNKPVSNFSISDTTPARNQWVTLTNTSTGQWDEVQWSISDARHSSNKAGRWFTTGPHKVRWSTRGKKTIKLRVFGTPAGAHTRTRTVTVH